MQSYAHKHAYKLLARAMQTITKSISKAFDAIIKLSKWEISRWFYVRCSTNSKRQQHYRQKCWKIKRIHLNKIQIHRDGSWYLVIFVVCGLQVATTLMPKEPYFFTRFSTLFSLLHTRCIQMIYNLKCLLHQHKIIE